MSPPFLPSPPCLHVQLKYSLLGEVVYSAQSPISNMSQVERKPTPPLHEEIEDKASINDISKGVAIANKQGLSVSCICLSATDATRPS